MTFLKVVYALQDLQLIQFGVLTFRATPAAAQLLLALQTLIPRKTTPPVAHFAIV